MKMLKIIGISFVDRKISDCKVAFKNAPIFFTYRSEICDLFAYKRKIDVKIRWKIERLAIRGEFDGLV